MHHSAIAHANRTTPAPSRMLWWFVALSVALHVLMLVRWHVDRPRVASLDPPLDVTLLDQQAASTRGTPPSPHFGEGKSGRPGETEIEQAPPTRLSRTEQAIPRSTPDAARTQAQRQSRHASRETAIAAAPQAPTTAATAQHDALLPADVDKPNATDSSARSRLTPSLLPASASNVTTVNRDELLQRIQRRLALLRDYPPLARRRGWEGDVHLTFRVTEHGAINAVRVALSSGFKLLDDNAVEALKQIRDLVAGEEIIDQSHDLSLAVRYRLIDG